MVRETICQSLQRPERTIAEISRACHRPPQFKLAHALRECPHFVPQLFNFVNHASILRYYVLSIYPSQFCAANTRSSISHQAPEAMIGQIAVSAPTTENSTRSPRCSSAVESEIPRAQEHSSLLAGKARQFWR